MNNTLQSVKGMIGRGSPDRCLSTDEIIELSTQALTRWDVRRQRVLVIIPDTTRTAPIPLFFRLFHQLIRSKVKALDFLIALGTHPILDEETINRLIGITTHDRSQEYPHTHIFNHRWDLPDALFTAGYISPDESYQLSNGMLSIEVPVRINRLVLDYDLLIACGPVFPHEVVGFSGGSKYFIPGISGSEIINFTHWLGALITSKKIIGTKYTPVRTVIDRAAEFIPRPKINFCMVVQPDGLNGLYIGEPQSAWSAAADLSAQIHIQNVSQPYQRALSILPRMYDDIWTGAKGMYKLEPAIAEGGEVVIYAPHISEFSYTHGHLIEQIGYHVRDYFVKQWERYKDFPWSVLAHSTHLRGVGEYDAATGVERPRIQVTLATGIPEAECRAVNLGYRDPTTIHPQEWAEREAEGVLLVPRAGEILYRLKQT